MRARGWLVVAIALSLAGTAACSPRRAAATIEVDKPVALADTPVHVRVSGWPPARRSPSPLRPATGAAESGGHRRRSPPMAAGSSTSTVPDHGQAPTRAWTAWTYSGR
jgi:hypothetical protein